MIKLKTLIIGGLLFLMCGFAPILASATPMADILYLEEDLGGGIWRYNYTVYNKSDPVADAGVDLFEILFRLDPVIATINSVPEGWGYFPPDTNEEGLNTLIYSYSLFPPDGRDVLPGDFLPGFVFDFNSPVGNLKFDVSFVNPNYPYDALTYSGTTAPVPEPATILLMTVGMAGIGVAGRKRARKSKG